MRVHVFVLVCVTDCMLYCYIAHMFAYCDFNQLLTYYLCCYFRTFDDDVILCVSRE